MDEYYVITLGREMLWTVVLVAAPAMVVGMLVGVIMALFQAITSVQEQTLTMIPKIMAVGLTLVLLAPFIMRTLATFTTNVFMALADAVF
ncbi:MAG TPA: hypothetical protein ENK43_04265 [Planctomycetes bacterium]|nr:hypothetical protein [Planctomycetota bacterium]